MVHIPARDDGPLRAAIELPSRRNYEFLLQGREQVDDGVVHSEDPEADPHGSHPPGNPIRDVGMMAMFFLRRVGKRIRHGNQTVGL